MKFVSEHPDCFGCDNSHLKGDGIPEELKSYAKKVDA